VRKTIMSKRCALTSAAKRWMSWGRSTSWTDGAATGVPPACRTSAASSGPRRLSSSAIVRPSRARMATGACADIGEDAFEDTRQIRARHVLEHFHAGLRIRPHASPDEDVDGVDQLVADADVLAEQADVRRRMIAAAGRTARPVHADPPVCGQGAGDRP